MHGLKENTPSGTKSGINHLFPHFVLNHSYSLHLSQQGAAQHQLCHNFTFQRPCEKIRLTVFRRKDFLICDQFLTETHDEVDVLRSGALRLLPPLIVPVVYSEGTEAKTGHVSCFRITQVSQQ